MADRTWNINFNVGSSIAKNIKHLSDVVEKGFEKMEMQTQALVDAVNQAANDLSNEMVQIADALDAAQVDNTEAQAVVDEQTRLLLQMAERIRGIIPDPEVP